MSQHDARIANARMYSVSPEVAGLWHSLLTAIIGQAGLPIKVIEHSAPTPIEDLWSSPHMGAVFMCGLPYSRAAPRPALIAAPVPSPAEYAGQARYWSDFVVRDDSPFRRLADTFGHRIAFTVPGSQSGCIAALSCFMTVGGKTPLFSEIIAPQITPLGAATAVIRGEADIAPIDSYAFSLLRRYRSDLTSQLRVIARTDPTPNPPLVASEQGLDALQASFLEAHRTASMRPVMDSLLLQRFVRPDPDAYDVLQDRFEVARRYWHEHPLAMATHPAFVL
jgi:ABC-type phosphate/phosphonate transport system substrate-binding protein